MAESIPMSDSPLQEPKRAKIFISYAHADSMAATRIADALKEAELNVWIDAANIKPGTNWVRTIDEALTNAGYLLALLSKAALQSQWVQHEWTAVLTSQMSSTNGGVVIPLRLEPVDPPTILRSIQFIDLFPNFDIGLHQLLEFFLSETNPAWLVQREKRREKQFGELAEALSLYKRKGERHTYSRETWHAWHNALHSEQITEPTLQGLDNRTIRRIALRCITDAEFQAYCFDERIQPGSLPGNSLNERIMSLLHKLQRDGVIENFVKWLAEESPRCVETAVKVFLPQR